MNQKGFVKIAVVVLVVVLVGVVGYLILVKKPTLPTIMNQPQTPTTPSTQDTIANWKIYRNENFGFEFKYPPEFEMVSSEPNEEQKKLDRGETISGIVQPSYDTSYEIVTFYNFATKEQFDVVIFPIREDEISPTGFINGNLDIGSHCYKGEIIEEGPTLLNKNGIPVLEVRVVSGGSGGEGDSGCYYFKNSKGNLIVFNIETGIMYDDPDFLQEFADFLNTFHFVGDQILSTLRLIK